MVLQLNRITQLSLCARIDLLLLVEPIGSRYWAEVSWRYSYYQSVSVSQESIELGLLIPKGDMKYSG